jgi:hypothetical protein
MRIGFDFDNTIVDYSSVFTQIANDLGLKYENNPKNSIKYYFEAEMNNPSSWKEVQLEVYCKLINNIKPSDKLSDLISWLIEFNHDFFIVSHKTQTIKTHSSISDLRDPAIKWIENNLPYFNKERIFFESSVIEKVRKIKSLSLDFFVDDLLTILKHHQFPKETKKILLNNTTLKDKKIYKASSWDEVKKIILDNEKH